MDFAVHRVKLKESKKKDKPLDLARELKKNKTKQKSPPPKKNQKPKQNKTRQKLWNMKVTVIPILIGAPKDWYRNWRTWK